MQTPSPVSERDQAAWQRDGFLLCEDLVAGDIAEALQWWAAAIAQVSPPASDKNPLLQHYEQTAAGPVLARSENFATKHEGMGRLITTGAIPAAGGALLGEPVVLYKEKINYKHAGGAGFEPHQDATAYKFVDQHITCMVAIDPVTTTNGCLEVAAGHHGALLPTNGDGCIAPEVATDLKFRPITMKPGDVLWFHSRTPHRSADNTSTSSRRALFLTFNAASQGDLRAAYYEDKVRQLRDFDPEAVGATGKSRVSTIGHFRGRSAEVSKQG